MASGDGVTVAIAMSGLEPLVDFAVPSPSSSPPATADLIFEYPGRPQRAEVHETLARARRNRLRGLDDLLAVRPPVSKKIEAEIEAARVAMSGNTTTPAATSSAKTVPYDVAFDKWILKMMRSTIKVREAGATVTAVVCCEDGGDALMLRAKDYASITVPLRVAVALADYK